MTIDSNNFRAHSLQKQEVLQGLSTDLKAGLTHSEVAARREQFGLNEMKRRTGVPAWRRFLNQFTEPLAYILVAASVLSAVLGEYVDAAVIFAVIFVNAIVGFIQESKAEKAIEALTKMVRSEATVLREGRRARIPSSELVPGDVVLLQSGDKVPADMRLLQVKSLQVDEAPLTGESVPVEKHADALPEDTVLADRVNMAFGGTLVTYGQATGVVIATGDETETGRIATLIFEAVDISTPLTRKISEFSRILVWVILLFSVLTFVIGMARGKSATEMFMAAVALAVGAIPEGLPAAVTVTLAIGVSRLAKRRAIIRKLPAVETLGSTTVICSDKTGTLTENQMTVVEVYAGGHLYEVTGTGYASEGEVRRSGEAVDIPDDAALKECLLAGLLCNDSQLVTEDGRIQVQGDPTEGALLVAAQKLGMEHASTHESIPRIDLIPFESEHMFMATLHRHPSGRVIYKKGSVEALLPRCEYSLGADGSEVALDADNIRLTVERMAGRGLRVLAMARRVMSGEQETLGHDDVKGGLVFLGLQGMIDPPRREAIEAVSLCQKAGMAVKMITGDHAITASAVASQLGLKGRLDEGGHLVSFTGRQLEEVDDDSLPDLADDVAVFARVAPEQKLRLVQALQKKHHIVAMTGDGVNDAPALKQANIGIAMGVTGTDVAKGSADMILTDDNFASIEAAVEEGRGVFDNLTKFIAWTLPTNGGEALILLTAIVLGTALPAQPVQLLWVNMMTSILLGIMLVFEPKEPNIMSRPPRDVNQPILTRGLLVRTVMVCFLMLCGAFSVFWWQLTREGDTVAEAQTAAVNAIVIVECFYLVNCRSLERSVFSLSWRSNLWIWLGIFLMICAQLLLTYAPFMNRLFHTAPIRAEVWLYIILAGVITFSVVELKKWIAPDMGRITPKA